MQRVKLWDYIPFYGSHKSSLATAKDGHINHFFFGSLYNVMTLLNKEKLLTFTVTSNN